MKICGFPGCSNTGFNRSDLKFFPLPRDNFVRGEWLEILHSSPRKKENNQLITVCELHFKEKDFKEGKKDLKFHAVPSLNISGDSDNSIGGDDEDEFIHIETHQADKDTFNESEVQPSKSNKDDFERKAKLLPEIETGRRPSRRAALVAAKKIHDSASHFGLGVEPETPSSVTGTKTQIVHFSSPRGRGRRGKRPQIQIDLHMECTDDSLTTAQAEALLAAQVHYNTVMKTLRDLAARKVKIVEVDEDGNPLPPVVPKKTPEKTVQKPVTIVQSIPIILV